MKTEIFLSEIKQHLKTCGLILSWEIGDELKIKFEMWGKPVMILHMPTQTSFCDIYSTVTKLASIVIDMKEIIVNKEK